MSSRNTHALLRIAPALAFGAGLLALVGFLVIDLREGAFGARHLAAVAIAWPLLVSFATFAVLAWRSIRSAIRPDPIRTLQVMPVGGAWRVPMVRRRPSIIAAVVTAMSGTAIAGVVAGGALGPAAWWHVAMGVAGSSALGGIALLISLLIARSERVSLVVDPREGFLFVPAMYGREHTTRVPLLGVRAIGVERFGRFGRVHRTLCEYDDPILGAGQRVVLLSTGDPARAEDLAAWIRGFVVAARAASVPVVPPLAGDGAHAAHVQPPVPTPGHVQPPRPVAHAPAVVAAAPVAATAPNAAAAHAAPGHAAYTGAPPAVRRARRRIAILDRVSIPALCSLLGSLAVAGVVLFGLQVEPQASEATVVVPETVSLLGRTLEGTEVVAGESGQWIWAIDVAPWSSACDEQTRVAASLRKRLGENVALHLVLVDGDGPSTRPTDVQARTYTRVHGLPPEMLLIRSERDAIVPRHRLIAPDGGVVYDSTGFQSAGSIERVIDVQQIRELANVGPLSKVDAAGGVGP